MNCIIIDDDNLSRKIIEKFIKKVDFLTLLYSFPNAMEAVNTVKGNEQIDLIFLDIEMPGMTGIDFLSTLKTYPQVIIVSAKERYAIDAFEYDVTDYLLKPIFYPRFLKAVNKFYDRHKENQSITQASDGIFIKKNSALVRINYDDILWVEALENYVSFQTRDDKFIIHATMKVIESKLPSTKFARVHRSYIVNLSKFHMIEDNSIVIKIDDSDKIIPIGKSYKSKFLKDLNLLNN